MTLRCPWCEQEVQVAPADIVVTTRAYRWSHCGQPIIRPSRLGLGNHASLAQLDRASGYGPEGSGFDSLATCPPVPGPAESREGQSPPEWDRHRNASARGAGRASASLAGRSWS